jgi:two-component system, NarL family, nitrate/nitrite response regulator NarL
MAREEGIWDSSGDRRIASYFDRGTILAPALFRHHLTDTVDVRKCGPSRNLRVTLRRSEYMSKSIMPSSKLNVFVGDGSQLSCQLIATALRRGRYQAKVVGHATCADGVRQGLDQHEIDVAVIGARLEDGAMAGLNLTRQICTTHARLNVVMILDSTNSTTVVEAFRAGASGIFSRDQSSDMLCKCIHAVHQGQVWANSRELRFVVEALWPAHPANASKGSGLLTKREEGVVHLVAEGLTNRDISQQLNLSEHTVRNYLFRIFNKVGTSNRLELALYAIDRRHGDN